MKSRTAVVSERTAFFLFVKCIGLCIILVVLSLPGVATEASQARLILQSRDSKLLFQMQGNPKDEWRFQCSDDLQQWSNAPEVGILFSDGRSTRTISLTNATNGLRFYRVLKTTGLYDAAVLRTVSLNFAQTNWQQRLSANYNSGSNLIADLTVDGTNYTGVGVRYKGNTSYMEAGQKKSLNIEVDYTDPRLRLMGYKSLNLNNASTDRSLMREPVYFNTLQQYTVGPKACFVRLMINGQYWGLYSFAQQVNGDLIKEWFLSDDGDRWKAPSGNGGGGTAGNLGRDGFESGNRALLYLFTNPDTYKSFYELKTQNSTNPWIHLVHAAQVLNSTPINELRNKVEEVLAVDRWLWFLALENIFADEDSYWSKGADNEIYYEPETGRLHPLEYDGNEALNGRDIRLSPVQGVDNVNRPVINRLLAIPELRQRYLAHMRNILTESFNPTVMNPQIDEYRALIENEVEKDTKKAFTLQMFRTEVIALKTFIQQRYDFLIAHATLRPVPPTIVTVFLKQTPTARETVTINAQVQPHQDEGIDSVWLYYRPSPAGRFTATQMFDDGLHQDGVANDGLFSASIPAFVAGTLIHYYIEARSGNPEKAAQFAPARAEQMTYQYRVTLPTVESASVVINELMASNSETLRDPQGQFDDWIELYNRTHQQVNLAGMFLSDDPQNPRKWIFPDNTTIGPNGFLIVWADENGNAQPGLHANFKLSAAGELLLLADKDENHNALLDFVAFGTQETDRSYGRHPEDPSVFSFMPPTPGKSNYP